MIDPQLKTALQDLADARDDLHRADYASSHPAICRFVGALDAEPLASTIQALTPDFDYATWRKQAAATRQLPWPQSLAERVACQIGVCRECGSNPNAWLQFMYEFRTIEGSFDARLRELTQLVFDPLVRDVQRLTERGAVVPVLSRAIANGIPATGDQKVDELLAAAVERFRSPNPIERQIALQSIWDAWERLKTLRAEDKKLGVASLVHAATAQPVIRDLLTVEARTLTDAGNDLHIRHFEKGKVAIDSPAIVDYLFFRMFALIWLFVGRAV